MKRGPYRTVIECSRSQPGAGRKTVRAQIEEIQVVNGAVAEYIPHVSRAGGRRINRIAGWLTNLLPYIGWQYLRIISAKL